MKDNAFSNCTPLAIYPAICSPGQVERHVQGLNIAWVSIHMYSDLIQASPSLSEIDGAYLCSHWRAQGGPPQPQWQCVWAAVLGTLTCAELLASQSLKAEAQF